MPLPLIPLLLAGGGAALNYIGNKKEGEHRGRTAWELNRRLTKHNTAQSAARNNLFTALLREAGVDVGQVLPSDVLQEILSTVDIGNYPGSGESIWNDLGKGLSAVAPYAPGSPYWDLMQNQSGLQAGGVPQGMPPGGFTPPPGGGYGASQVPNPWQIWGG